MLTEAGFIPRPGGRQEDDGVLLSILYNGTADASVLGFFKARYVHATCIHYGEGPHAQQSEITASGAFGQRRRSFPCTRNLVRAGTLLLEPIAMRVVPLNSAHSCKRRREALIPACLLLAGPIQTLRSSGERPLSSAGLARMREASLRLTSSTRSTTHRKFVQRMERGGHLMLPHQGTKRVSEGLMHIAEQVRTVAREVSSKTCQHMCARLATRCLSASRSIDRYEDIFCCW
jgi:hypothetical protein